MPYTLTVALFAAVGFSGASLLALRGSTITSRMRAYAIATAAGILLGLAFADLFPESIELGGRSAIIGFIAGFTLLFLVEVFTNAHTHHSPDESLVERHRHPVMPFVVGLALHNFADGFAVGITASVSEQAAIAAGLGVLVHQIPVGLSVASVLMAAAVVRRDVLLIAVTLGLVIPLATLATLALPGVGDEAIGAMTGMAAGNLTYLGSAHLLPEARAEHPSRVTGIIFVVVLALTTLTIFTILGE